MTDINPLVVDLSHWDPADDYAAAKRDGIAGVIYKATEGGGYSDPTYVAQQHEAKAAGLVWGAYHFADASNVQGQIDNFMRFAAPDPDELFCLDWEDNGGDTMSLDNVIKWIDAVETRLDRPGECVLYGGNTVKERGDGNAFLTERRLWLCQYGPTPTLPEGFENYWLWQFTDGVYGPTPHRIDGIGPCDINHFDGTVDELVAQWASGKADVPTPAPVEDVVTVIIAAPEYVTVRVRQVSLAQLRDTKRNRRP